MYLKKRLCIAICLICLNQCHPFYCCVFYILCCQLTEGIYLFTILSYYLQELIEYPQNPSEVTSVDKWKSNPDLAVRVLRRKLCLVRRRDVVVKTGFCHIQSMAKGLSYEQLMAMMKDYECHKIPILALENLPVEFQWPHATMFQQQQTKADTVNMDWFYDDDMEQNTDLAFGNATLLKPA